MKKEDFEQAIRKKLQSIPLETRKQWDLTKLNIWWEEAKAKDTYLTWERCPGNVWEQVKRMCSDLIGNNAIW